MTDGERETLRKVAEQVEHNGELTEIIYAALFEVPKGSPEGDRPLIEMIRIVVRAYQRASWITRVIVWLLPTAALIGASIAQVKGWFAR
jgi:hypothetical protein